MTHFTDGDSIRLGLKEIGDGIGWAGFWLGCGIALGCYFIAVL